MSKGRETLESIEIFSGWNVGEKTKWKMKFQDFKTDMQVKPCTKFSICLALTSVKSRAPS